MYQMAEYYDMIFKRKSFHLFRGVGNEKITQDELAAIESAYRAFDALSADTKTAIRIVPADKVNFKRDAEYCIMLYSEKKENYLMNAGYLGEQLDLWLAEHHIGSLWFGIGKPDEQTYNGLDYVIMIAIRKVSDDGKYRKDMYKAKRKSLGEVWSGDDPGIADVARFAPSACNSQPWYAQNRENVITVYRRSSKKGIMSASAASYYNRIDMGIYLCILEICMKHRQIGFERELFCDDGTSAEIRVAAYRYSE